MDIQFDKKEIRDLEKFVIKKVEDIVFGTRRDKEKVKGGHLIEDASGELRRKIKSNKNFIKWDGRGFTIELKMKEYFKYLDDARRDDLNWYLSEAIFEDKELRDKIKEVTAKATKRTIIKLLSGE